MSGRQMKQFACLFLCFFFAASAAALAESMPVSAGGVQTESVSEAETPAIEEDFWLSGDYMLSVLYDMDGERRVEIYMEDAETGRQMLWVFPCSACRTAAVYGISFHVQIIGCFNGGGLKTETRSNQARDLGNEKL